MKTMPLILFFLTIGCSTKPQAINYGSDKCSFCQMTIVDRQHAGQIVTEKGKAYKYDAIECMLNELKEWNRPNVAEMVVNDYNRPGTLIHASEASYLISKKISSPMGAFLTAFSSEKLRERIVDEEAQRLDWEELKIEFEIEK